VNKICHGLIILWMLTCSVTSATAQVSIGIGLPNVSIGINLPLLPELVPVPGYPVYYAPRLDANYFFYDGMYWVYQNDNWYASSWYNGPWGFVQPSIVPLFILRIPVSYYRQPPVYFRGWQPNAPPRWGQHWGHGWEQRRRGWDRWNRSSAPARAPLPAYQRQYSGDRYPRIEQQHTLRNQNYRYQSRDKVVRQHFTQQAGQKAPAPAQQGKPQTRSPIQQGTPVGTHSQPPHRADENIQRSTPVHTPPQQRSPAIQGQREQPGAAQHMQQTPRSQDQGQRPQGRGDSQNADRGHGQGQNKDEGRGGGRNN